MAKVNRVRHRGKSGPKRPRGGAQCPSGRQHCGQEQAIAGAHLALQTAVKTALRAPRHFPNHRVTKLDAAARASRSKPSMMLGGVLDGNMRPSVGVSFTHRDSNQSTGCRLVERPECCNRS